MPLHDLDPRALGSFFDYYLTFAISAEVGVLIRWLIGVRARVTSRWRVL